MDSGSMESHLCSTIIMGLVRPWKIKHLMFFTYNYHTQQPSPTVNVTGSYCRTGKKAFSWKSDHSKDIFNTQCYINSLK